MNINELCFKENKQFEDYFIPYYDKKILDLIYCNISNKNLTSLEGLPNDFNSEFDVSNNKLKNLKDLPKHFNSVIWLNNNDIQSLDGLNDVLLPKNIYGLDKDFIVSEYIRLGKHHLLI